MCAKSQLNSFYKGGISHPRLTNRDTSAPLPSLLHMLSNVNSLLLR